jgi:hypothetical protein
MSSQITYDFKFVSRKQKEELDLPNDYYDLGLKLASDSYFTWILGNDCELAVQNWDMLFYSSINNQAPEIFLNIENNKYYYYFIINDDTHYNERGESLNRYGDLSCCFPILSSNYCKDLGEFYPKEIFTWGGDTGLYRLISRSNKVFTIDAINIIGIKHYSVHNDRIIEQDEIFKRVDKSHMRNWVYVDGYQHFCFDVEDIFMEMWEKRKKFLINE